MKIKPYGYIIEHKYTYKVSYDKGITWQEIESNWHLQYNKHCYHSEAAALEAIEQMDKFHNLTYKSTKYRIVPLYRAGEEEVKEYNGSKD